MHWYYQEITLQFEQIHMPSSILKELGYTGIRICDNFPFPINASLVYACQLNYWLMLPDVGMVKA